MSQEQQTEKEYMRNISSERMYNGATGPEILESKNHKSLCALRIRTQKNMAGDFRLKNLFNISHALRNVK